MEGTSTYGNTIYEAKCKRHQQNQHDDEPNIELPWKYKPKIWHEDVQDELRASIIVEDILGIVWKDRMSRNE